MTRSETLWHIDVLLVIVIARNSRPVNYSRLGVLMRRDCCEDLFKNCKTATTRERDSTRFASQPVEQEESRKTPTRTSSLNWNLHRTPVVITIQKGFIMCVKFVLKVNIG